MKKIFYIVLVIVALMVISRFVKQGNQTVPSEVIAVEEVVPEGAEAAEAVSEEVAVDENGNPIAEEETVSEAGRGRNAGRRRSRRINRLRIVTKRSSFLMTFFIVFRKKIPILAHENL